MSHELAIDRLSHAKEKASEALSKLEQIRELGSLDRKRYSALSDAIEKASNTVKAVLSTFLYYNPDYVPEGIFEGREGSIAKLRNSLYSISDAASKASQRKEDGIPHSEDYGTITNVLLSHSATIEDCLEEIEMCLAAHRPTPAHNPNASSLIADLEVQLEEVKGLKRSVVETQKATSKQQDRLESTLVQFQSQFSEAQDKRLKEFDNLRQEINEKLQSLASFRAEIAEDVRTSAEESLSEVQGLFQTEASEELEAIREHRSQAEEVVGLVANQAMAGHFRDRAEAEKDQAKWFRRMTYICMALVAAFAIYFFFASTTQEASVQYTVSRAMLLAILSIPVAYFARQADSSKKAERYNRSVDLRLRSLNPYLAELPENDRNEIKKELAARLFSEPNSQFYNSNGQDATSGRASDILQHFLKNTGQFRKG